MDTSLRKTHPGRQHPTRSLKMSVPQARSGPPFYLFGWQRQAASNRRKKIKPVQNATHCDTFFI